MERKTINRLVAGNVLSCDAALDKVVTGDVSDALLFCQLYADKKADRFAATAQWFAHHDKAMQELKWIGKGYRSESFEPEDDASISLAALIEKGLHSYLPVIGIDSITRLLKCVAGLAATDPVAVTLRTHAVRTDAKGSSTLVLQVSVFEQPTLLSSLFVTFTTASVIGEDPLHQVFPGSSIVGLINVRFFQRSWSSSAYQNVRSKVLSFLSEHKDVPVLVIKCDAEDEVVHD